MSVQAISWALKQRVGNGAAKFVLITLANYADADGNCWPSQATLAAECEVSVRAIREYMLRLEMVGLISREERRRDDGSRRSDMISVKIESENKQAANPAASKLQAANPAGGPGKIRHQQAAESAGPVRDKPLLEPTTSESLFGDKSPQRDIPLSKSKIDVNPAVEAWNETAGKLGWAKISKLTPARRQTVAARLRDHGLDAWLAVLRHSEGEAWLTDPSKRNGHESWKPNIDWFAREKTFLGQLERMGAVKTASLTPSAIEDEQRRILAGEELGEVRTYG